MFLLPASFRNQKVETALQVAYMAILEAGFEVPYLTIEALDAWTPSDITVEDLMEYAKRYMEGSNRYFETAQQRGVFVEVYDYTTFKSEGLKLSLIHI